MSTETLAAAPPPEARPTALPAQRIDEFGRVRVDYKAIALLALPLMLNSGLQAIVSLTDTWFVGHISTSAIAAMGAVYWVVLLFLVLVGGVGFAVQTFVAQAEGGRRRWRAAHATWIAIWAGVLSLPIYATLAWAGGAMFGAFGLDPEVERQAVAFWQPRMLGGPLAIAVWAVLGFFNGISRPRVSVMTTGLIAIVNAVLNWLFVIELELGIAGSAWATNASMACGILFALRTFLRPDLRALYRTHLTWRPDVRNLVRQFRLGLPMGAMAAADLFGLSLFQLMQVRLSQVEGAASQIVLMLTSVAYMPGIGVALASTTLVGQSVGAGDRTWARTLGNRMIALNVGFMGAIGLLLAAVGPLIVPSFVNAEDPSSGAIIRLSAWLLWIAAAYQAFDGLNLGSASGCVARATRASPRSCFWSSHGACSCRWRTRSRSRLGRAGSTSCRSSASAPRAAGSRWSCTSCCSAACCSCAGVRRRGSGSGSEGVSIPARRAATRSRSPRIPSRPVSRRGG
jgi:MATE family multidrug resistance protein